jgi:hypothetical protein
LPLFADLDNTVFEQLPKKRKAEIEETANGSSTDDDDDDGVVIPPLIDDDDDDADMLASDSE